MKVAVSGASGLVGSALVPELEAAGHSVLRLVRRAPTDASEVEWNPALGTIDSARLAGVQGVVTLSGENIGQRWTDERKAEILESRVSSTGLLAQTVAELEPRPAVLVCAGGVDIYGDRGDEILTEESPLGSGFLADVGRAWEASAVAARTAGIRVVNFRQGIVLTRQGGALGRMLLPFKLGLGGRVGSGKQWWSWVALEDVVAAYRFALEKELEGPLNVMSPNPVTNATFVKALGAALHRPTVFPLPAVAVRTAFGEMGETVLLGSKRVLPAKLLDAGFAFAETDLDSALDRALAR